MRHVTSAQNRIYQIKAKNCRRIFLENSDDTRYLYTDVQAAYDGDPAAYSTDEVIFSYPGIFAITVYRIAHELVRATDSAYYDRVCTQPDRN